MTNEELVKQMLEKLGGKDNVRSATNCQTRLRVQVNEDAKIDEAGLKNIEGVLGIVHDRPGYIEVVVGPGKCRKCADICHDMGIASNAADVVSTSNDWKTNKSNIKADRSRIRCVIF